MQAITTKFLGPTNTRGTRIKASAQAGNATVGWDYGAGNGTGLSDTDANHDRAAIALIRKLGWFGTWARGATPDGKGNVYVCLSRAHTQGQQTVARKLYNMTCLDSIQVLEGGES